MSDLTPAQKLMKASVAIELLSEQIKRHKYLDPSIKDQILGDLRRVNGWLINIDLSTISTREHHD